MSNIAHRKGAVSIFVVVFTAMLITIVAISFTRLMLRDQMRASDNDLSQSAYDSALAGVEDAKRALARYERLPSGDSLRNVDLAKCNAMNQLLMGDTSGDEVQIGSSELEQAYTCVKVNMKTDDFIGSVSADRVRMVPLKSDSQFNRVQIEWFSREDITTGSAVNVPANSPESDLPASSQWPQDRPPVLETQLVQTDRSFRLSQFDAGGGASSNTNTLFLYPKQLASDPQRAFSDDSRRSPANGPTDVRCTASLASDIYSCRVTIRLPEPIDGSANSRSNTYLRLTPRYNAAHFRVTMQHDTSPVRFDGVQPMLDSTGRANNLFRRVSARVELGSNTTVYPDGAVDVRGNFCKTFLVTDKTEDYAAGNCRPRE